ncbi:hypothetical protein A6R68_15060 [Neotoma lepida]|uniref:Uncharacterized protein n=1 Tax=Neotoma lepida TaxID=56216 RepID=A0A1A6H9X4_NEOLE|nr:hypothetical protein A6R68_15060 [Neotoma lepida]
MLLRSKKKKQSQRCQREDTGWVSANLVIDLGSKKQRKPQTDNISRVPSKSSGQFSPSNFTPKCSLHLMEDSMDMSPLQPQNYLFVGNQRLTKIITVHTQHQACELLGDVVPHPSPATNAQCTDSSISAF